MAGRPLFVYTDYITHQKRTGGTPVTPADARHHGKPTADAAALDADVLIAAQAIELQATVVTSNPTHLQQLVTIHAWP